MTAAIWGPAIAEALEQLRHAWPSWEHAGEPCGLLVDGDDPVRGYVSVPEAFRSFASFGVDGVHTGLWVDDPDQRHEPTVVMATPMDDPVLTLMAVDVATWLDRMARRSAGERLGEDEWARYAQDAADRRTALDLPPIPG